MIVLARNAHQCQPVASAETLPWHSYPLGSVGVQRTLNTVSWQANVSHSRPDSSSRVCLHSSMRLTKQSLTSVSWYLTAPSTMHSCSPWMQLPTRRGPTSCSKIAHSMSGETSCRALFRSISSLITALFWSPTPTAFSPSTIQTAVMDVKGGTEAISNSETPLSQMLARASWLGGHPLPWRRDILSTWRRSLTWDSLMSLFKICGKIIRSKYLIICAKRQHALTPKTWSSSKWR